MPSELLAAGPWAVFDVALLDKTTRIVLGVLLAVLAIAYGVGRVLRRQPEGTFDPAVVRTFNQRVRVWWLMWAILAFGFILGPAATYPPWPRP